MRIDDFFQESPDTGNPWDSQETELNAELLTQLAQGTAHDPNPLETALSLTRLVRAEYESYGTEKAHLRTDEDEARAALKTLRMVLKRRGIVFNPPWRDFSSFQTHWHAEGARGSWQARRDIIEKVFRPIQDQLEEAEEQQYMGELTEGISPHKDLGWTDVDDHIAQLRQRFRSASTAVDYKDVGNRCVGVLEALSAHVYDPAVHCPPGATVPPVDKTDIRIGAYIDHRLPGKSNEELRGLTKKASALSHKMKHSPKADRTTTGIAADAVILLANILRRLEEG
ncbi:hypothetical protein [Brevibacterium luteolum]|uniref:Abortive infection protein-like C-terminal domain-containing protein n=1 Tax=Brevibacterium luteolum TaxID=199591 RepID=A0A2N6PK12_9MICO|nr:hypothetical protein [Brevibacterium luteolum]PMB99014.1 hypothetical protein CJ198_00205 [Brevibacterium luteolum]